MKVLLIIIGFIMVIVGGLYLASTRRLVYRGYPRERDVPPRLSKGKKRI